MRQVRVRRAIVAAAVGLGVFGAGSASAAVEFDRVIDLPTASTAEHSAWVDPAGQRVWGGPEAIAYISIAPTRVPRRASTFLELENGTKAGGPVLETTSLFQLNAPDAPYTGAFYVSYLDGTGTRVREEVGRLVIRDPRAQSAIAHPKEPLDIVVVVDTSASISTTDPLRRRRDALDMLFAMSKKGDRVGVVKFGSGSRRVLPLTTIRGAKQAKRLATRTGKALTGAGETNYDAGFNLATETLIKGGKFKRRKQVIFLTDGVHDFPGGLYQNSHMRLARNPTGKAWPVCALRIGSASTTRGDNRLNRIADDTKGFAGQVDNLDHLPEAFAECIVPRTCTHNIAGDTWDLARGQSREGRVVVPLNRRRATFRITGRRRHQLRLRAPSGRVYGPKSRAPGIRYKSGRNWAMYEIDGPRAGAWTASVKATGLKAGATDSVLVRTSVDRCGKRTKLLFPGG